MTLKQPTQTSIPAWESLKESTMKHKSRFFSNTLLLNMLRPWIAFFFLYTGIYILCFLLIFNNEQMMKGFGYSSFYNTYILAGELVSAVFWVLLFAFLPIIFCLILRTSSKEKVIITINWVFLSTATAIMALSIWIRLETGSYPGLEGLRMLIADGSQIIEHALHFYPLNYFVLLALAIILWCGMIFSVSYLLNRLFSNSLWMKYFTVFFLFTVIIFALTSSLAKLHKKKVIVAVSGEPNALSDYLEMKLIRFGPTSLYCMDLLNELIPIRRSPSLAGIPPSLIQRKKQITMDEYTSRIKDYKTYDVIVLLVESMRPDQLKAYHGPREVMPNLDALSDECYIFNRAYAQSSHSNYADICPLSSHYPLREKRTHFYPKHPSYPRFLLHDLLKPLGFETAIISSQNENWGKMLNYYDTGNLDYVFHAESVVPSVMKKDQSLDSTDNELVADWMLQGSHSGKLDDSLTIQKAIEWIHSLPEKQPYSLYINLQSSHFPYSLPHDFPRRFVVKSPNTEAFIKSGKATDLSNEMKLDAFSDSLYYIDVQIGHLISALKRMGRYEKTIIVVSADTSTAFLKTAFGKPYIGNGGNIWEEVIHVPLFIKAPGISHEFDSRLVQHIDVLPTITGLMGLPMHPSFQGLNLFNRSAFPHNRSIYITAQSPTAYQLGILQNNWYLIHDERFNQVVLYQYPDFGTNVLSRHQDIAKALLSQLNAWRNLQLEYYGSKQEMKETYPPILLDSIP
jgi:arylsulfatase A-like enzyme